MKRALVATLLATLLAFAAPARAQKPQPENFRDTLTKATLAVYAGKQTCGYVQVESWFGKFPMWQCGFESHFTCTATAIGTDGQGNYMGLTAGHCFDYKAMDKGYKYFVSDSVKEHPVLHAIDLTKFENNDQYDYALFRFQSMREIPTIPVAAGDNIIPAIGSHVLNANYSFGVVKEVTEGIVVSAQIGETEGPAGNLRRRFLVQMPFGPGASGSAIVDEDTHRIVGLTEAMFPETQMAAIIIPTGKNFIDFVQDDSVGLKPQPEPKQTAPAPGQEETALHKMLRILNKYFHKK